MIAELDPFYQMGYLCLFFIFSAWLLSVLTKEYSWVDRLWSTAPPIYALYVAGSAGFANPRLNLMAFVVFIWGARLTYNFFRKGGFSKGGEDYRWEILRNKMTPWQFQVFNATFISPFQLGLIYLFSSPLQPAWEGQGTPLQGLDYLAAGVYLLLVLGETIADEQMWAFQNDKKAKKAAGEEIVEPFYRRGLYTYSRHPNYFCEISMWWAFYLFGVSATGEWLNWTLAGAVILTLLFDGSVRFSESISASKYPSYKQYQQTVSRLIPMPVRRSSASVKSA